METDSPTFEALMEKAYEVVKKIGPGGLLFVEEGAGREGVERVTNSSKRRA